jgi:molybdopterin synthase sulfur carrier subunit
VTVPVRLPAALRPFADGQAAVEIEVEPGADVGALLDRLAESHPALERRLRDEQGRLRPHVNLFLGGDNIRDLDHLATPLPDGAEVAVLPAISGG